MDEETAARQVRAADIVRASAFGPARRRAEFLTWRAVAYRELGPDAAIGYDAAGGPLVCNDPSLFMGVSHGAGRVAVILADEPCAVDIESSDRCFDRVRDRYLSPAEAALGGGDPAWAAVAWCAKETLYKLTRRRGLDLLEDVRLTSFDGAEVTGCVSRAPEKGSSCGEPFFGPPVRMRVERFADAVMVCTPVSVEVVR